MTIRLPGFFKSKLASDPLLEAAVHLSFAEFHPWISASGTPFFPGYTDHGPDHISEVLATASSLITDEARKRVTAADVAVLSIAILLHDCGMHLTEDSFRELIFPRKDRLSLCKQLDTKPWDTLWQEFLGEASRFDDRKISAIFGDMAMPDIRRLDLNNLSAGEKLLIGEFLRRHHARLAHEIALEGVPFSDDTRLCLKEMPRPLADLAGFVARSHGVSLRSTYAYLESTYDLREFQGVHAIYLMAVLRIGDYLQVHSERASKQLLKVKRLRSPISRGEWKSHHAIRDIRVANVDPEAIVIDALPGDVEVYLKLRRLFADIQSELDNCWSVLGEVYGRYKREQLTCLTLSIRRIRSTIDDPAALFGKVDYVPQKFSIEAAGTDLFKLLVRPLYGNDPNLGLREILQNAVDACLERQAWTTNHPLSAKANALEAASIEVTVELHEMNKCKITVRDTGIGMTAFTIKEYFLKVGATYRHSEIWRREFEDDTATPKVLRGGRFGIGVLALFLISDEIEVTTRYVSEPADRGLHFRARLDMEQIQVAHCHLPVGTTITMWLRGDVRVAEMFRKRWFMLARPRIDIRAGHGVSVPQWSTHYLPVSGAKPLPSPWKRSKHPDFADIQWTYRDGEPRLVVNGFIVSDDDSQNRLPDLYNLDGIRIRCPCLSVFDPKALFPLDLKRTLIAGPIPFKEELTESIVLDFLARICLNVPNEGPDSKKFVEQMLPLVERPDYNFWQESPISLWPLVWTSKGFGFLSAESFAALKVQKLWGVLQTDVGTRCITDSIASGTAVAVVKGFRFQGSRMRFEETARGRAINTSLGRVPVIGARTIMQRAEAIAYADAVTHIEWEGGDSIEWAVVSSLPRGAPGLTQFLQASGLSDGSQFLNLVEWQLPEGRLAGNDSLFLRLWRQAFGEALLPLAIEDRRKILKAAPDSLTMHFTKAECERLL